MKIVCQHILQNDPLKYYPSTETKQLYAASIVKSFPCLATKNQDGKGKFASFFVFGVEYPQYLDKFFNFFEQFVFSIFPNKGKINSSNQEFANTLDAITENRQSTTKK